MLRQHAFTPEIDAERTAVSLAQAARQARSFRRRAGVSPAEEEDFRQEILVDLVARAGRFDPDRGSWPAFVCVVTGHAAATIARRRRREAIELPAGDDDFIDPRSVTMDLVIDLARIIERAPETVRNVVALIAEEGDVANAGRASSLSRASFYRTLSDLRTSLRAQGIDGSAL
jgi:DNA-directed RNA polymerase specialized sigma24 family protein